MKRLGLFLLMTMFIFTSAVVYGEVPAQDELTVGQVCSDPQSFVGKEVSFQGLKYGTRNDDDQIAQLISRSDCYVHDQTGTMMVNGGWQFHNKWSANGTYEDRNVSIDKEGIWTIKSAIVKVDEKGLPYLSFDKKTPVQFTDISGHWAESIIHRMAEQGIVQGVGEGKFMPNKEMTRSEFAYMLHNMLGIEINYFKAPDIKEFFEDVDNESWYAGALYDLVVSNIVDDRGTFRPNDPINREEMMHYSVTAYNAEVASALTQQDTVAPTFEDENEIKLQYKEDVKKAIKLGLIKGRANGHLSPKAKSTRAEVLVVVDRLLEKIGKKGEKEKEPKKVEADITVQPGSDITDDVFVLKLSITNNSKSEVTINHTSSQKYDFELLDPSKQSIYRWSASRMFMKMLTETKIGAGETVDFAEELDLQEYGDVVGKSKYLIAYITGDSEDFTIDPAGYEAKLYAEEIDDIQVVPSFEFDQDVFRMKVEVINSFNTDITIDHTSGQKYDFALFDKDQKEIYRWSEGRFFTEELSSTTIKPRKTLEFSEELALDQYDDIIDQAVSMKAYIKGTSEDFFVDPEGYGMMIKEVKKDPIQSLEGIEIEPSYEKGDKAFIMKMTITNGSESKIVIDHSCSQSYDFALLDDQRNEIYRWSEGRFFLMMLVSTEIQPGEKLEFTEKLDMEKYSDIVEKAKYLKAYIVGQSDAIQIRSDEGYEVKIK